MRELRSDQGTNFVGARNELNAVLKELDTTSIKDYSSSEDCDLIDFNLKGPPSTKRPCDRLLLFSNGFIVLLAI